MTKRERRLRATPRRRTKPDMHKLSRALLALAAADAEREAQAQHEQKRPKRSAS